MIPRRPLITALLLLCAATLPWPAEALEKVRLQLKWTHQFQFAGYYAAQKLGYYREAGLDVAIIPAAPGVNAVDVVLQGGAEYGVSNSGLLLARSAGKPVVVLAVILQHSPFVLLTHQESTTEGIQGLAGGRLMLEPLADEIIAFLIHEGMPIESFEQVLGDSHNLESFISGEIDAIDGYITDEPYQLMRRGIAFNVFHPRMAGIDFYGDNFFTTEEELAHHPDRVKRFREASLRGWRYALEHQSELIELILNNYPSNLDRDTLTYEAQQIQQLMHPELIDIGYMLEKRWQHIADNYAVLGMLPGKISLDGFLYKEPHEPDLLWFYMIVLGSLAILAAVTLVALRFVSLNRQLSRLLRVKNQFVNVGESVNHITHQWKQPLNELAIQLMRVRMLAKSNMPSEQACLEVVGVADRGHEVLDFMAATVDSFGRILKTRPGSEPFSPHTVLQDVLHLLQDSLAERQIAIDYETDCDAKLLGNPTDFSQILLSILTNAREIFAERAIEVPHIFLKGTIADGDYILTYSDNGGGISASKIDDIFNLGFSAKRSPDTGVGLYIARELAVNSLGGTLSAHNGEQGAVFTLTIPVFTEE